MNLAIQAFKVDENGSSFFRKDLSAQNKIVESLVEIFNSKPAHRYFEYTPKIANRNNPGEKYSLNISKCLKEGANRDELNALFELGHYFYKHVFEVFNKFSDKVNNQKSLKSVQYINTTNYVTNLFKKHDSLFLLRGGVNLVWAEKLRGDDSVLAKRVLLNIAAQFFKSYKQTPLGKIIHGFMWRLEPSSKTNHLFQFVFFCDAGFMINHEKELKTDVEMFFNDIAEKIISEQMRALQNFDTLNLKRIFQVEFFNYTPSVTMSINEVLSRPFSRTKFKRKLDKEDLVLKKMHGLVTRSVTDEEREALKRLVYYFCHIQDHFEFEDLPTKKMNRRTKEGFQEYVYSVKTFGRGQEHKKKTRRKQSK